MKRSSKRRRQQQTEPDPTPILGKDGDDAVVTVIAEIQGVTHLMTMRADIAHGESVGAQLQQLDSDVWADRARKGTTRLVAETTGECKTVAVHGRLADDLEVVLDHLPPGDLDGGLTERLTVLLDTLRGRT